MGIVAGLVLEDYYFNVQPLQFPAQMVVKWAVTMASFALLLGLFSLLRFHYGAIKKRTTGRWVYSVWAVVLLVVAFALGFGYGPYSTPYQTVWFFLAAWPLVLSVAIQGLYQASAAYRAFRVRSLEAAFLFFAGVIVIAGYAPLVTGSIVDVASWLVLYPNNGAQRAVEIGLGIGIVVLGFRVLIGRERTITAAG
jgi:hypothetical protein